MAKDVKCKKSNTTVHNASACISPGQARATEDRDNISSSPNSTLALEYLQPSDVAHSNSIFGVALTGVGEGEGHHSKPTPPLLL